MIVDIPAIKQAVSEASGYSVRDLEARKATKVLSFERQKAIHLCSKHTEAMLPEIGRSFGDREHKSVVHALDSIEAKVSADDGQGLIDELERLRQRAEHIYVTRLSDPFASISGTIVSGVVEQLAPMLRDGNADGTLEPSTARLSQCVAHVLAAKRAFESDQHTRGERVALTRLLTALSDLKPAFSDWSATLSKHQHGETP